MSDVIADMAASLAPELVGLRHELHQHPEIRFEEQWTSNRLARFLEDAGIPFERGYAKGTGIIAEFGRDNGPMAALRTDIDALEIHEETGLPYASTIPNRMHACGHDGHMAVISGAAKLLKAMEPRLPGRVRIIYQPAEEIAAGGSYMVEEGAMEGVGAVFGLHGWPTLPLGHIGVKPGPMMASANDFKIVVRGQGCHAAMPHTGVDPIYIAAEITTALQGLVTRQIAPTEPAIISIGEIKAGSTSNIIPESAMLQGTFRSFNEATDAALREGVVRVAQSIAQAHRAEAELTFNERAYPPTVNDPAMTALIRGVAAETFGEDKVLDVEQPTMGAEDFSFYLREAPGAYVWLGVNPNSATPYPALHNPRYDFTDGAIPIGMELMAKTALRFLQGAQA